MNIIICNKKIDTASGCIYGLLVNMAENRGYRVHVYVKYYGIYVMDQSVRRVNRIAVQFQMGTDLLHNRLQSTSKLKYSQWKNLIPPFLTVLMDQKLEVKFVKMEGEGCIQRRLLIQVILVKIHLDWWCWMVESDANFKGPYSSKNRLILGSDRRVTRSQHISKILIQCGLIMWLGPSSGRCTWNRGGFRITCYVNGMRSWS